MAWTDVPAADVAAGAPLKTGTLTAFRGNDEANADKPFFCPLTALSALANTTYPGTANDTLTIYCPEDALSLDVVGPLWITAGGTTAFAKIRVYAQGDSGNYAESAEQSSTETAKGAPGGAAEVTMTIADVTDVGAGNVDLRGRQVVIELYLRADAASSTVHFDADGWPGSRTRR